MCPHREVDHAHERRVERILHHGERCHVEPVRKHCDMDGHCAHAGCITRVTAATTRSNSCASCASCFRPAAVIE